jgi:hypothetical protein
MRIIVVDAQTDRICGDIADVEATLDTPPNGNKLERLCKAAARSVGGDTQEDYEFDCFAPCEKASGYFVFLANEDGGNGLDDQACPVNLGEVFMRSFYLGYVHRRPQ